MGNVFLYRMPSGIPGDVSRKSQSTIEAHPITGSFAAYGLFGKLDTNGNFAPLGSSDTAVYGLLVRAYPVQSTTNAQGPATPPTSGIQDVLRRGYMTVSCNAGTAKKNGTVYVRVANAAAGKPIGGIEAVADITNTIALTNAIFMHDADAAGNVEISYNI